MSTDVLLAELKGLRRGRAVYSPDVCDRIGERLREVCAIDRSDPPAVVRQKLTCRLGDLAKTLPDELRVATVAALAIHPHARHLLLQDRLSWLAEQLSRDGRTARRRVDEGFARLAEAAAGTGHRRRVLPDGSQAGWFTASFEAVLHLDRVSPEARERRTVVAEEDGIADICLGVSLPREHGDLGRHDLLVDVDFGGSLQARQRPTDSRFQWSLALPAALRAGERHDYGVTYRLPPGQPMRSHYVFTPARRCDRFDLRIRFGDVPPAGVRRLDGVFYRDLDERAEMGEPLRADRTGEVRTVFTDLCVGFGYGVRWSG